MAKKVVASLQKRGAKDITKAIKMVKSDKSASYSFREEVLNNDKVKDFFAKK
jgi:ACT domain-containing protein